MQIDPVRQVASPDRSLLDPSTIVELYTAKLVAFEVEPAVEDDTIHTENWTVTLLKSQSAFVFTAGEPHSILELATRELDGSDGADRVDAGISMELYAIESGSALELCTRKVPAIKVTILDTECA